MLSKDEALYLHRMEIRKSLTSVRNFERILMYKDYENGLDKMRKGATVGIALGGIGGVVKYLGKYPMSAMASATFSAHILAKSATAGILYTSSSNACSVLRGNVDGPLNHFISGFLTTLFVMKPPYLYWKFVTATFMGLNTAFLKFIYVTPKIQRYVENRHIEEGLRKRLAPVNYGEMLNMSTEHRKKDIEHLEKYL